MNPQIFLSGYGLRPHGYGEFGSESATFWISFSRVEKYKYAGNESDTVWTANPDIFEYDDVEFELFANRFNLGVSNSNG